MLDSRCVNLTGETVKEIHFRPTGNCFIQTTNSQWFSSQRYNSCWSIASSITPGQMRCFVTLFRFTSVTQTDNRRQQWTSCSCVSVDLGLISTIGLQTSVSRILPSVTFLCVILWYQCCCFFIYNNDTVDTDGCSRELCWDLGPQRSLTCTVTW